MASLKKITAGYRRKLIKMASGSSAEVSNRTVDRTPVLSGSSVLSWTPSIGSMSINDVTLPVPDEARLPYGMWDNPKERAYKIEAKAGIRSVAPDLKSGETYYFVNPKEYILEIEYESKSYRKAPAGMRSISIAEWKQIVNEETRKARGS